MTDSSYTIKGHRLPVLNVRTPLDVFPYFQFWKFHIQLQIQILQCRKLLVSVWHESEDADDDRKGSLSHSFNNIQEQEPRGLESILQIVVHQLNFMRLGCDYQSHSEK
jgi:hypothetical protein